MGNGVPGHLGQLVRPRAVKMRLNTPLAVVIAPLRYMVKLSRSTLNLQNPSVHCFRVIGGTGCDGPGFNLANCTELDDCARKTLSGLF
jgi:hypothetical protein